jgi:L-asparagine transporter-like permease
MRMVVKLLHGFLIIGAGMGAFDAEALGERVFDATISGAAACIIAIWFVIARSRAKKPEAFDREVGLKGTDRRGLGIGFSLLVGLPAFAYVLIEHTARIETANQEMLAASLGACGLIGFVIYLNRWHPFRRM